METSAARAAILGRCRDEGFDPVRVAPAGVIDAVREAALSAKSAGRLDGLEWMTEAWLERATDPAAFLEGAQAVVMVGLPYEPPSNEPLAPSTGKVAAYAAGRDYHRVFEKKLRRVARFIREELGAGARPTVDYGPLLERPLAAAAGMGWQGKSTMLLAPGVGPWLMLGAVATTLPLEPDEPLRKTCGSCTRCIVACPTGAISPEGELLDARLCISYHTIENRGSIPRELRAKFGAWIFGCDDCLTSCPVGWKHKGGHPDLRPREADDATPALVPLLSLTEAEFAVRYRGRAIMRAKRDGFVRNVCVALGNVGTPSDVAALVETLSDDSALVREHAAWALGRLGERFPGCARDVAAALSSRLAVEGDAQVLAELELVANEVAKR